MLFQNVRLLLRVDGIFIFLWYQDWVCDHRSECLRRYKGEMENQLWKEWKTKRSEFYRGSFERHWSTPVFKLNSFIGWWSWNSRALALVLSGVFAIYILQTFFWWSEDNVAYKNMHISVRLPSLWFQFRHSLVKQHLETGLLLKYFFLCKINTEG